LYLYLIQKRLRYIYIYKYIYIFIFISSYDFISPENQLETLLLLLPMARQPLGGLDLLIIEASPSHSDTPRSVRLLWTSDQPDTEIST
jgi:hypothetical protein